MLSSHSIRRSYKGLDRRSSSERRISRDRRNLIRFESFGSDRRLGLTRRSEERIWERNLGS